MPPHRRGTAISSAASPVSLMFAVRFSACGWRVATNSPWCWVRPAKTNPDQIHGLFRAKLPGNTWKYVILRKFPIWTKHQHLSGAHILVSTFPDALLSACNFRQNGVKRMLQEAMYRLWCCRVFRWQIWKIIYPGHDHPTQRPPCRHPPRDLTSAFVTFSMKFNHRTSTIFEKRSLRSRILHRHLYA